VGVDGLPGPVAQLDLLTGVHLVEVVDAATLEHSDPGVLLEEVDEILEVRPADRDDVATGRGGGAQFDEGLPQAVGARAVALLDGAEIDEGGEQAGDGALREVRPLRDLRHASRPGGQAAQHRERSLD